MVLWLINLRNIFLRIRSFVDPGKSENYQNHKNVILRVLHPFYLLHNSTLSLFIYSSGLNSIVILPLCISFEFIHFILKVGFLHSVKCLAKRCKYRITV